MLYLHARKGFSTLLPGMRLRSVHTSKGCCCQTWQTLYLRGSSSVFGRSQFHEQLPSIFNLHLMSSFPAFLVDFLLWASVFAFIGDLHAGSGLWIVGQSLSGGVFLYFMSLSIHGPWMSANLGDHSFRATISAF